MGRIAIDLTGKRFGNLTVLCRTDTQRGAGNHAMWVCRCDCGKQSKFRGEALRAGRTHSCGCVVKAHRGKRGGVYFDLAMTHAEIGEVLGLTRERIRQIEVSALKKLQRRPELLAQLCELSRLRRETQPSPTIEQI